jgi:hypothetical protein
MMQPLGLRQPRGNLLLLQKHVQADPFLLIGIRLP